MGNVRLSVLLLLAALLAACGGAPATTPPAADAPTSAPAAPAAPTNAPAAPAPTDAPAAEGEKTTVTLWLDTTGGGTMGNFIAEQIVAEFNETHANIVVEANLQANAWDAVRTALAGGAGPDIVITPGPSFVFELARAGQLLPLDDYAASKGWADSFVPWALDLGKVEGQLYSVPAEVETLVLYYNKTLFEEKGWQPPKTTDELMALAEQIQAEGIIPFGHANAEWRPANEWFVGAMFNSVAGPDKVYAALTGEAKWTDPEFVRAVDLLTQKQQQGYYMGGLDRYYTATGDERRAALGAGEAAMNLEGTWFMGDINNFFGEEAGNTNDWDWVPVPTADGTPSFDLGIGSTWSINKNAQNPEAAAEFLTYYFAPETQARLINGGYGAAPVKLEAAQLTEVDPRQARAIEELGKASDAGNYGYTTWTFWPPKSDVYIYEEIEKVWAGELTSQQYLEGLQQLFDEELAAGAIPPIPAR